ncbi:MAG: beta-lactamase family protein [Anaerolineae bacterium]|nr:beta-lactamase family protein [Gloeobacterales cyanobacterium ES-bin-313]
MKRSIFLLFNLLLFCAFPKLVKADAIDDFVLAQMKSQHIPGLSMAVIKNGQIVKAKGYGLANVELNVPVSPQTIFQSGSVGKQFTATAVMMLVEQGKLSLDDKISQYFENSPPSWKNITVRNLLTHTSGIKDYEEKGELAINLTRDYTDEELTAKAMAASLDFPPGEQWKYSNTGYVLLGILVKKVSGQFYGDLLRDRVFKPLDMKTTRNISDVDIIPNRSSGYTLSSSVLKNQEYVSPSLNRTADGSLYFTVFDLAKWDAALYTEKLLKKESFKQIWTPVTLNSGKTYPYGFGWFLDTKNGHRLIQHSGGWQGFTTHISRYVDDKLTVVVLTNLAGCQPNKIANGVAGFYLPALK